MAICAFKAKRTPKTKKAAGIRSKEQLDAMSSEDLKRTPMPLTVRAYLLKIRTGGDGGAQSGRSQAGRDVSDPYGWMHPCLARLLPESMQSNEQLWNGLISALKAADVRSKEQLDAMSSEDLKMAQIPLTVRTYLVNNRKSGESLIAQATLSEGAERGENKEEKTDQMKPDEAEAAATATADTGPEEEFQNNSAAVAAKAEGLENKSIKELREMCKAQVFKKVRSIVIFFSKYTRALTFENLWK